MSEERKNELLNIFANINDDKKKLAIKLIDELCFLEDKIEEVKKTSFYRAKPNGELIATNGLKIYKELSNQYNLDIKTLSSFLKATDTGKESPLGEWLKDNYKKD